MRIAEIFYSVQGEGSLIGVPSVFVRTSGCNLRCVWCDTPYTSWHPEGEERAIEAIVEEVRRHPAAHVVVTGGEPMLAPGLAELTRRLDGHITIETAGTVDGEAHRELRCDLMSVSPKLANSTPRERDGGRWAARHEALRYRPEALKSLIGRYPYQLKFVIESEGDLDEVGAIVDEIGADSKCVMLMPEGTDAAALAARGRWLVELCKRRGFRFSPRLHVDLWGHRRGV